MWNNVCLFSCKSGFRNKALEIMVSWHLIGRLQRTSGISRNSSELRLLDFEWGWPRGGAQKAEASSQSARAKSKVKEKATPTKMTFFLSMSPFSSYQQTLSQTWLLLKVEINKAVILSRGNIHFALSCPLLSLALPLCQFHLLAAPAFLSGRRG